MTRNRIIIIAIGVILVFIGAGTWVYSSMQESLETGQVQDFVNRGIAAQKDGDYFKAYELFQRARELEPDNSRHILRQAHVAFLNDDYEIAMNLYNEAEAEDVAEVTYYSALQALSRKQFDTALKLLNDTRGQLQSGFPLEQDEITTLENEINTVREEANKPRRDALVGKILIEKNALDLSKNVLNELLEQEDDYRDGYYLRAVAYYKGNETAKAREDLERALSIDPQYEPAKKLLEKL